MARRGENITKRKDGRWEARVIYGHKPDGKAIYKFLYGKTYREVRDRKLQFLTEIDKKAENIDKKFDDILDEFVTQLGYTVKRSTYARYRSIIDVHIRPYFGAYSATQICAKEIDLFTKQKLDTGRTDQRGGLAPKTVSDILSVLSGAIKFAEAHGYDMSKANLFAKPRIESKITEVLSINEEVHLVKHMNNSDDCEKFGVILCLHTGLRIGELCALRWADIDLDNRVIFINKTMQRLSIHSSCNIKKRTEIVITSPKTSSSMRIVPIPDSLVRNLQYYKLKASGSNPYFLTATDSYIEPSNYYAKYQRWLKQCGVRPHPFHVLRHTFATRCIENGFDPKSLSEILGHSDVKMTLSRYVHPSMDVKRRELNRLALFLSSQINSQENVVASN